MITPVTGSGSPVGVVTPSSAISRYVDTETGNMWWANGPTAQDWVNTTGGPGGGNPVNLTSLLTVGAGVGAGIYEDERQVVQPDLGGNANGVICTGFLSLDALSEIGVQMIVAGLNPANVTAFNLTLWLVVASLDGTEIATALDNVVTVPAGDTDGTLRLDDAAWDNFTQVAGTDLTSPAPWTVKSTAGGMYIATLRFSAGAP